MTAIMEGNRVIAFEAVEGEVSYVNSDGTLEIKGEDNIFLDFVPTSMVRLVPPRVERDEIVDGLPDLPHGSVVIQLDTFTREPYLEPSTSVVHVRNGECWCVDGKRDARPGSWPGIPFLVVYVAGGPRG